MRAAPPNFTAGELQEGCIFAHARGRRVYLTLNTLPTNEELTRLPAAIEQAAAAGVDAFIIADLGVLRLAQKYAPGRPTSTFPPRRASPTMPPPRPPMSSASSGSCLRGS